MVATTAGAVIQLDATTGQCVRVISANDDSSSASSTNPSSFSSSSSSSRALAVTAHPAMAVAFSAHVDGTVRVLDLASGRCVHRLAAHADAVTALAVVESTTLSAGSGASGGSGGSSGSSASVGGHGRYLVTAGHDAAVRTWDLGTQRCVHDLAEHQTHRRKYDEGVHAVALHRASGLLATAGADSIVRVFAGGGLGA